MSIFLLRFLSLALEMMAVMEEKLIMLSNGCIITKLQMKHALFIKLEVMIMECHVHSNLHATIVHQGTKDAGPRMTIKCI